MQEHLTRLPPEVVSLILGHLRPRALGQCLLVNSAFKALVFPLLSRFVLIDEFYGRVTFPLLGGYRCRWRGSDRPRSFPRHLSSLTVLPHEHFSAPPEGETFFNFASPPQVSSCRVLTVHLFAPDDYDNLSSAHVFNGYPGPAPEAEDLEDGHYVRPLQCYMLHFALENARIDKLVLRNVPVVWGRVDPDLLSLSALQTVREAVIVLNADGMSDIHTGIIEDWNCSEDVEGEPVCAELFESLAYPLKGSIGTTLPRNAEELTFVFWTPKPAQEVSPSCCSASGRPTRYNDESGDYGTFDRGDEHESCWEDGFWYELAEAVVPMLLHKLRRVTIVNASSIIPT